MSGDATELNTADISFKSGTTVLSSAVNDGSLVGSFSLASQVISPNGDGINDELGMECEVLAVVGKARITVDIFDLSGNRVRRLLDIAGQSGVYRSDNRTELRWDATDASGGRVAPGLYLIQLNVDGDARSSASTRILSVAY